MDIKGRIIKNAMLEKGTSKAGKEWKKGSVVVETLDSQYPKQIYISNLKQAEEFAKLAIGSIYTFSVEVESREFNGKYYTSVSAWRWVADNTAQMMTTPVSVPMSQPVSATPTLDALGVTHQHPVSSNAIGATDDLPF